MPDDSGVSAAIATVLLIGIIVVLAAAVFALLMQFAILDPAAAGRLQYLRISSVDHLSEIPPHPLTYDSRVTLTHRGNGYLANRELRAVILRNGIPLPCEIPTFNGHDFIPLHPAGIQWIGGAGTRGGTWDPGEEVQLDFADGTFRPGDLVTVRVIHGPTGTTISEDSVRA
ncbi:MAG: hypothetical protein LUQ62_04615 [Methanomicrobiales archaeon]|nr:hypothetical protein [Methanomicrobiales archaeon]